ncbi:hypothetical protein D3C71_1821570 [compost metagenome]
MQANTANGVNDLRVVGIFAQQGVPDVRRAAVVVVWCRQVDAGGAGLGEAGGRQAGNGVVQQQRGVGCMAAQFGHQRLRQQLAVGRNLAQGVQREAIAQAVQKRVDFLGVAVVSAILHAGGNGVGQGGA